MFLQLIMFNQWKTKYRFDVSEEWKPIRFKTSNQNGTVVEIGYGQKNGVPFVVSARTVHALRYGMVALSQMN